MNKVRSHRKFLQENSRALGPLQRLLRLHRELICKGFVNMLL